MRAKTHGLSASVHSRLIQRAQSLGVDVNLLLTRFATERFLYRLSRSPYAERFVLKGALLMLVWLGETIRPTRDADLLGFGDVSDEAPGRRFLDALMNHSGRTRLNKFHPVIFRGGDPSRMDPLFLLRAFCGASGLCFISGNDFLRNLGYRP